MSKIKLIKKILCWRRYKERFLNEKYSCLQFSLSVSFRMKFVLINFQISIFSFRNKKIVKYSVWKKHFYFCYISDTFSENSHVDSSSESVELSSETIERGFSQWRVRKILYYQPFGARSVEATPKRRGCFSERKSTLDY